MKYNNRITLSVVNNRNISLDGPVYIVTYFGHLNNIREWSVI